MAKKGKGKGKGGKGKSKGLFGAIGSALGSIPVVGKVKNAAKSVKKKVKKAKNKVKKKIKKAKKKLKKKIGKVYTKARKLKNNLSKSKIVKKFKQVAKKAVLATKKAVQKTKATVTKAKQQVKAAIKDTKKVMTKVAGKVAITYNSFKEGGYKETLSAIVDFIPVVGNIKSGIEIAIGRDLITKRKLEDWERGVGFAAVFGGGLVKGAVRGGKFVSGIVTGGKKSNKNSVSTTKPSNKNSEPVTTVKVKDKNTSSQKQQQSTNKSNTNQAPASNNKKQTNSTSQSNTKPSAKNQQTKGTGKLDRDLAKAYLKDIEVKTGRKVPKEQIGFIKEALRNNKFEKLTPKETAKHRSKFTSSLKDRLIGEWEEKTNQKWPRYTEEVFDKNGEVARSIGQPYDAHHIIENNFGGPHEWWNIHPAKYPDEHQAGIHGKGSPSGKLFPRR